RQVRGRASLLQAPRRRLGGAVPTDVRGWLGKSPPAVQPSLIPRRRNASVSSRAAPSQGLFTKNQGRTCTLLLSGSWRRNQIPNRDDCGSPPSREKGKGKGACAVVRGGFAGPAKFASRVCAALAQCSGRREWREPQLLARVPGAQPAVACYLTRRGPRRRAELQQFGDQGLAALRQLEAVGVENAALLAPREASDVRVVEGHAPGDHDVEHDAQAPYVILLGVVGDAQEYLGRGVGGRAAVGGAQVGVAVCLAAEAEVGELDAALVRAQQHVFALEVAVDQVVVVQVAHGSGDLCEEVSRLPPGDAPVSLNGLQQVGGGCLHHDVQLPVAHLNELKDVHDVRVPHSPKYGQLSRQELVDEVRRRAAPVHHLDGHRALVLLGRGHLHLGVTALAYRAAQLIAEFAQKFVARHGGAWSARGAGGGCCQGAAGLRSRA
uniref:Uncharacterized protein n=1 Tax=Equus asinus TaxID=9793 RepID=A0A9L0K7F7_EQUAS